MITFKYSTRIAGVTDNMRLVTTIEISNGVSLKDAELQQQIVSELREVVLKHLRMQGIPADLEE